MHHDMSGVEANGPGRPRGSRNLLGEEFVAAVYEDWTKHGQAVLAKVRTNSPGSYLRVVASLVPRDQPDPVQNVFSDLADAELIELLEEEIAKLKRSTR